MNKIPYKEIINDIMPYAPDDEGVVRINHDTHYCNGDSKSLLIRRKDDGSVYAKCYRCGRWGSYRDERLRYQSFKNKMSGNGAGGPYIVGDSVRLPAGTRTLRDFSPEAKVHARKSGITQGDIDKFGILWSDFHERVIFPVYRDGELIGFQARSYTEQPKYWTKAGRDRDLWQFFPHNSDTPNDWCVVVEDFYSAIRCIPHMNSFALLGNNISDKGLDFISSKCNNFLIFLDNDQPDVKRNARSINERLTLMGKHSSIVTVTLDPKYHSEEALDKLLNSYIIN